MKSFLQILIVLTLFFASCTRQNQNVSYYFDAENGNDTNHGKSPEQAFKSLHKIQSLQIKGGDSILLKSGSVFTENPD